MTLARLEAVFRGQRISGPIPDEEYRLWRICRMLPGWSKRDIDECSVVTLDWLLAIQAAYDRVQAQQRNDEQKALNAALGGR